MNYYGRHEVSNSDLSELKLKFSTRDYVIDCAEAYKFGRLIDAMITEPEIIDYFNLTIGDDQYSNEDFENAKAMKKAFVKDPFCKSLMSQSTGQDVFSDPSFSIEYSGFEFQLPVRCKYDLWSSLLMWGGDIKSTTAKTQKEFEAAVDYFDYDRQRAWYMDITKSKKDVLIGISKVNKKIFKVPIDHDSKWYKSGKQKYQSLSFKWWALYSNF